MSIIKFKSPGKLLPNNGGGGIDYSKWRFNVNDLINLKNKCKEIIKMYEKFPKFSYLPITLSFSKVVPKSSRIKSIFKKDSKKPSQIGSNYVFNDNNELTKINLVYSCNKNDLSETIDSISKTILSITDEDITEINKINNSGIKNKMKKEKIKEYLKEKELWKYKMIFNDLIYIENVEIKIFGKQRHSPIISIYEIIDFNVFQEMLLEDGILITDNAIVANEFLNINVDDLNKIIDKYPFIISQAVENIEITFDDLTKKVDNYNLEIIDSKGNGEQIGIIDTNYVLHGGWQTYHINGGNFLPSAFESSHEHGTNIASLLIGRDYLNPHFSDNLGEFNVKTFESLSSEKINVFYLMKNVEKIIKENTDIKIWNLSFGAPRVDYKLSVFGKLLDILQYKYDVQFIVASGNDKLRKLLSPADSFSAISVGAVYETNNKKFKIASYTGRGKVFGIFEKPSTYEIGNDFSANDCSNNFLQMLNSTNEVVLSKGTSYATPLVARKVAFLKQRYSINLEISRAIINYLTKISTNLIADLSVLENGDTFIFVEGQIQSGERKEISIKLPFNFDTRVTKFTVGYSVSYNVANTKNLGDEYSCVEISTKLSAKTSTENGNISIANLVKPNQKAKVDGENAEEVELRKHFGKYNPNKVVIDKNFNNNKGIKIKKQFDSFSLVAERVDLFDHISKPIKYGALFGNV